MSLLKIKISTIYDLLISPLGVSSLEEKYLDRLLPGSDWTDRWIDRALNPIHRKLDLYSRDLSFLSNLINEFLISHFESICGASFAYKIGGVNTCDHMRQITSSITQQICGEMSKMEYGASK